MAKIHGAYTAMITPMLNDGSVDYDGFKKNVLFKLEQGIDGLLPLGTSGETPTLSEDEEDKLLDIAIPLVREFNAKNGKDVNVIKNTKNIVLKGTKTGNDRLVPILETVYKEYI